MIGKLNLSPIYIPSKGRDTDCKTAELLQAEQIPFTLVVEPQDACDYKSAFPDATIQVLKRDDSGIAYVRNVILRSNHSWFWMLDDDIKKFYRRENRRMTPISALEALQESEKIIRRSPRVAQGAIEYQQFAWSTKRDFATNSYCDVCVLIDGSKSGLFAYDPTVTLKEDRDFTLQLLSAGYLTIRVQRYGFSAPKNGSNAGGLKSVYEQQTVERASVDRLAGKYPHVVKPVTKKDGRYDAKIKWSHFK